MTYQYRHALLPDDPNLQPPDSEKAKLLRAAFAVADRAHAGQSRKKIDPTIMYISHPLIAYDIMTRLGEDDAELLASTFLHDTLEVKPYIQQPDQMRQELHAALLHEGIDDARADELAEQVQALVAEVTNAEEMVQGKEAYQIDKAPTLSLRGKKLKLADQAASLVDNLMMANDPAQLKIAQETQFTEKAIALGTRIIEAAQDDPSEREALKSWDAFYARTVNQSQRLFDFQPHVDAEKIAALRAPVRRDFNFDLLFSGETLTMLPSQHPVVDWLPVEGEDREGLSQVGFDIEGNVAAYIIRVTKTSEEGRSTANRAQLDFAEDLRYKMRGRTHRDPENKIVRRGLLPGLHVNAEMNNEAGGYGRLYQVTPPLAAEIFGTTAYNSGVCSLRDSRAIRQRGVEVAKANGNDDFGLV